MPHHPARSASASIAHLVRVVEESRADIEWSLATVSPAAQVAEDLLGLLELLGDRLLAVSHDLSAQSPVTCVRGRP